MKYLPNKTQIKVATMLPGSTFFRNAEPYPYMVTSDAELGQLNTTSVNLVSGDLETLDSDEFVTPATLLIVHDDTD